MLQPALNPTLAKSTICINVKTTPPQASISGELTNTAGYDATTNGKQPLHADGTAQIRTTTTQPGVYIDTLSVYNTNGDETATTADAFDGTPPHTPPTPTFGPACPEPTQ